jgi:hypothetical protein
VNQLWSWGLAALGVGCLYLISRKATRSWGWFGALAIQALWVVYAVVTRQWGFIASSIAYGFMYGRNLLVWRKEKQAVEEAS